MPAPIVFRGVTWDWSRPYILGIVNVTPDSFSDGGRLGTPEAAVAFGERLLADGADGLDVGGESTRPGAPRVSADEELNRVLPVIRALAARGAVVSIDTTKAAVASAAIEAGAQILNDVSMGDPPEVLGSIAACVGGAYIRMHSRGTAATMRALAEYDRVVDDVANALRADAVALEAAGVDPARIILDPGIGFAKRADQSLSLLAGIARIRALGYPLCVGPSRKSFIDDRDAYAPHWADPRSDPDHRVGGTAAAVALCVDAGVEILRVHDAFTMRQAARIAHAVRIRREREAP